MLGQRWTTESTWVRICGGLLVVVLLWGTLGHVIDLLAEGVLVYDAAPAWLAGYWIALTALDPAAAALVILRRRTGLVLAAVVLVTDAAANGYAIHVLELGGAFDALGLTATTAVAAATIAILPWLWPRTETHNRDVN